MERYKLVDRVPVQCPNLDEWARTLDSQRKMFLTKIPGGRVSTVFLGMDHNFFGEGPPLVFETMVFPDGAWGELDMERYATWAEAEAGHAAMVEKWKGGIDATTDGPTR